MPLFTCFLIIFLFTACSLSLSAVSEIAFRYFPLNVLLLYICYGTPLLNGWFVAIRVVPSKKELVHIFQVSNP